VIDQKPAQTHTFQVKTGKYSSNSTDGTTALLMLETEDGDSLALAIPAGALRLIRALVNDAMIGAARIGLSLGNPPYKSPSTIGVGTFTEPENEYPRRGARFQIGSSDHKRNHVAIIFDGGTPSEVVYFLADQDALQLCARVGQNIASRNPALTMPQKRIILPGGRA
jgi:hypothetical protein